MSDFSTNADEEDIEGVTDWFIDTKYEMNPVEGFNSDQMKKFKEVRRYLYGQRFGRFGLFYNWFI